MELKRLNVGCGRNPLPDYVNLDKFALPGVDCVFDLEQCRERPLPFDTDYFDEIRCEHTLEHIHNILPLMEELWRVAKPKAQCTIHVPFFQDESAFGDPTHVRYFGASSFSFYGQPAYKRADYGYRGDWKIELLLICVPEIIAKGFPSRDACIQAVVHWHNIATELRAVLTAVKPARAVTEPDDVLEPGLHILRDPQILVPETLQ